MKIYRILALFFLALPFSEATFDCTYFGDLCTAADADNAKNCVPKRARSNGGLKCTLRTKMGGCQHNCEFGGDWCPDHKGCEEFTVSGGVQRRCVECGGQKAYIGSPCVTAAGAEGYCMGEDPDNIACQAKTTIVANDPGHCAVKEDGTCPTGYHCTKFQLRVNNMKEWRRICAKDYNCTRVTEACGGTDTSKYFCWPNVEKGYNFHCRPQMERFHSSDCQFYFPADNAQRGGTNQYVCEGFCCGEGFNGWCLQKRSYECHTKDGRALHGHTVDASIQ